MKTLAAILVLGLATAVFAGASAPTSRPAGIAPEVQLTPIGALRAYNVAMLKGDKDDLLTRIQAAGEDAQKLATAEAANDALVGKLRKLATTTLDDKAAHLIGRALNDIDNEDTANATVTVEGDHAVVSVGGGAGDTQLVLHDGQWKIDADAALAREVRFGISLEERLAELKIKSDAANALLSAMESGKIKSVDDALFILRRELSE